MANQNTVDVNISNEGSMFLFTLNTEEAKDWVEENVSLEGWQWLGDSSFAVDSRFAHALAEGMSQTLTVK